MAGPITIVAGGARSGKTERLLARFRAALGEGATGAQLWIAPNVRAASDVASRVLEGTLAGYLTPGVLTFDQFGRQVLAASRLPVRPLDEVSQRELLARLVEQARAAGELEHFAPIADTSGFLDLLARYIRELKRLEIWPHELSETCGRRSRGKERELCLLYERYQQLLTDHNLYDPQGRFWAARAELRERPERYLASLQQVFVDGFTDFTRTELEILQILAARAGQITISLPLEPDEKSAARRGELFAKCRKTLAQLRERFGELSLEWLPPSRGHWPAIEHLECSLFANPHELPTPPPAERIEILAAAGVRDEIELVAREIKSLLIGKNEQGEHARPHEVLVIFRALADVRDLVEEVFAEYGIPSAIEGARPLARSPVLGALAGWLRLDAEDWTFHEVLALLTQQYFRPDWPEWRGGQAAQSAERLVRRLQIPSGREALLTHAARLAERARELPDEESDANSIARLAEPAAPLLRRMAAALDALPRRATAEAWSAALTDFATDVGLIGKPTAESHRTDEAEDLAAWQQWLAALDAAARLDRWLGAKPRELSRSELSDYLAQVVRHEALSAPHDEHGRVRVLSAESARPLAAPYVFLAGLSERSFPAIERDDCLMSEQRVRELAAAGLPLVSRREQSGFEMLLFYEVVTRATRRLTLSYPALDQAAQPLAPSPYLTEIERAFGNVPIARYRELNPRYVPQGGTILSPREFRVRAVQDACQGDYRLMVDMHRDADLARLAPNVVSGLAAAVSRRQSEFGPYEGMLLSEAARRVLAERFGPEHLWSPSRLEQYAGCPFQFFVERVLGLEPLEDPALATDYARRGQMLHALLSALHRKLNERAGEFAAPSSIDEQDFAEGMAALVAELLDRLRSDRPLADGLLEIDARRLQQWLDRYRQQHAAYDKSQAACDRPPLPAHFEVSFGHATRADAIDRDDPLSSPDPLVLECQGQSIRFAGRIDRIDLGSIGGQVVFNVVDYKSSARAAKHSADDELYKLQLPLYALAAQQLLTAQGALPYQATYWHVAGRGPAKPLTFAGELGGTFEVSPEWQARAERLRQRVASLVSGVRQGQFPMYSNDKDCTSLCAYSTVCRVNQARSLEKAWQPPGGTSA